MASTLKIAGIGEWMLSNNPAETLKTYALGSCVALILHHPASGTCGMIHVALPDSLIHPDGDERGPGYYADTGVPILVEEFCRAAHLSSTAGAGIVASLAGGASVLKMKKDYNIGGRIVYAMERFMEHYGIPIVARDVGGELSRTVSVLVENGTVVVASPGKRERVLV